LGWLRLIVALLLFGAIEAKAQVVALGDSSTKGYDVPESETWPAKLKALLRQRGVNVSVANQGINGDTSDGMLGRLDSAVPNGTRVVIFTCCGNDNKDGNHVVADHDSNIRTIVNRLRARAIAVVYSGQSMQGQHDETGVAIARRAGASWCGWVYQGVAREDLNDSPAGRHPTPKGHDAIAARMLPCVLRALGRKG
jgi:acyl-CoA thioesterase I